MGLQAYKSGTVTFDGAVRFPKEVRTTKAGPLVTMAGGAVLYVRGERVGTASVVYQDALGTMNEAEYWGLTLALDLARRHGVTHLMVFGDSQLVIRQMLNLYKCRAPNLKPWKKLAQGMAKWFSRREYHWQRREMPTSKEADKLAGQALGR